MSRRRTAGFGIDVWPVVADCFIGVFGMYVVVSALASRPPTQVDTRLEHAREELLKKLEQQKVKGDVLGYCVGPASVRIVYPETILSFETCSWDLPPQGAERVRNHLREELFRRLAETNSISSLRIEGHADPRRAERCLNLAPFKDNLQLSQNRARAVFNALLTTDPKGMDVDLETLQSGPGAGAPEGLSYIRKLLQAGNVSVAGFGSLRPYRALNVDCSSADSHTMAPESAQNRRVEVTVELTGTSGVAVAPDDRTAQPPAENPGLR